MTTTPRIARPFVFALLAMVCATLLAGVVGKYTSPAAWGPGPSVLLLVMVGSLAATIPLLFVEAGVYHVLLMLLGGASRGFGATFRVCAYVDGSTALISWVPVLGPLVALVFGVYLRIVGIREIHRTTTARAFGSVFLAFFVPLLLFGAMAAAAVAFVLLLLSGAPSPAIEV